MILLIIQYQVLGKPASGAEGTIKILIQLIKNYNKSMQCE